jgi:16S rRNA (guanine527-N7)-methyltransferase
MSREAAPLTPERFDQALGEREPSFGLSLGAGPRAALARFLSELDGWRRRFNLTGNLSASELTEHTLESALGASLIADGERVVDIGSGSGFPGIVLAILKPGCRFTLVEPRQKKAAFLRHVSRQLGLVSARVLPGRIEEVGGQTFDTATTRAVGDLASRIGQAAFLEPGGQLLAWTTEPERLAREISSTLLERTVPIPGSERKVIAILRKA